MGAKDVALTRTANVQLYVLKPDKSRFGSAGP
jgi:hypothetical protein